jgi:hypothetical protein
MRLSIAALQHAIIALLSSNNASAFMLSSNNVAERRFPSTMVCNSIAKDSIATTATTTTTTTGGGGAKAGQAEVVLVGCGAPNRGMGWYHAIQMLEQRCPSASLDYIVEPWFLGGGASGPGGAEFTEWANDTTSKYGTVFTTSLTNLPQTPSQPRLALISGRTADNPALLSQCIAAGCSTIYLEKPGAPTVKELQQMQIEAQEAGVEVLMGYNKVSSNSTCCVTPP